MCPPMWSTHATPGFSADSIIFLQTVTGATIDALVWLGDIERAFITWNKVKDVYEATALGKASAASGLPTEQCLSLYVSEGGT